MTDSRKYKANIFKRIIVNDDLNRNHMEYLLASIQILLRMLHNNNNTGRMSM